MQETGQDRREEGRSTSGGDKKTSAASYSPSYTLKTNLSVVRALGKNKFGTFGL